MEYSLHIPDFNPSPDSVQTFDSVYSPSSITVPQDNVKILERLSNIPSIRARLRYNQLSENLRAAKKSEDAPDSDEKSKLEQKEQYLVGFIIT